jgi:hypothetical protein
MKYLCSRDLVSEPVVDRNCSALGVHPSAIYGTEPGSKEGVVTNFAFVTGIGFILSFDVDRLPISRSPL